MSAHNHFCILLSFAQNVNFSREMCLQSIKFLRSIIFKKHSWTSLTDYDNTQVIFRLETSFSQLGRRNLKRSFTARPTVHTNPSRKRGALWICSWIRSWRSFFIVGRKQIELFENNGVYRIHESTEMTGPVLWRQMCEIGLTFLLNKRHRLENHFSFRW